jgi:hypothetical protein
VSGAFGLGQRERRQEVFFGLGQSIDYQAKEYRAFVVFHTAMDDWLGRAQSGAIRPNPARVCLGLGD